MLKQNEKKVWKIRTVKTYPEAHNHIIVGRVIDTTDYYVRLDCRTYHFGRAVNGEKDICEGSQMVRVIPWARIEIINELADSFDYTNAQITSGKDSDINIKDKNFVYSLVSYSEKKY
ncbi:MAG: hypothetical protein WC765_00350 [Phycisphaerae bacterium]|jgi:hypothetical protein